MLFHAHNDLTRVRPNAVGILPASGAFLNFGHFSVTLFICISGYVLSLPVARDGVLRGGMFAFFKRRARRLLPAYYVALALSIPFALFNWHVEGVAFHAHTFVRQLVTHVSLVHNISNNEMIWGGINGPMWTVAVEFQIYIIFGLLLLPLAVRFGLPLMVAVAFGLGLLPEFIGIAHRHPAYFSLGKSRLWYIGVFALGSAAALAVPGSRRARLPWGPIAAVLGIAAISGSSGSLPIRQT